MRVERLTVGALDTNCWIVDDGRSGPALVIDPAAEAVTILEAIGEVPVSAIVLTHGHFDHLEAAGEVCAATSAPLLVHEADAPFITSSEGTGGAMWGFEVTAPPADRTLVDGDVIEVGELRFEVLHTPGHTPGCICLYGHGHLFSGDTLFASSVGRTDFPRGDGGALRRSITGKLAPLADETIVHPGHGPDTTIGRERMVNPFFPRG